MKDKESDTQGDDTNREGGDEAGADDVALDWAEKPQEEGEKKQKETPQASVAKNVAQDPELRRALRKGIPLAFAIASVDRKVQGKELMRDMVVYVPFFILFLVFFVMGQSIGPSYWLAASMRDLLTGNEFPNTPPGGEPGDGPFWAKGFFDIAESSDWYSWLEGVAVFYLWDNPRGPSEPNLPVNFGTGNNHLLGSARIRTLRVSDNSCESNEYLFGDVFPNSPWTDCYAPFATSVNDITPYGSFEDDPAPWEFQDCALASGSGLRGKIMGYPCGGHVIDIPFEWSYEQALELAQDLTRRGYVDDQHTRLVSFELYTYCPVINIFTNCKYFVEATTGGSWIPFARCRNFSVWSTADAAQTALEVLFFLYVAYYWFKFFIDWRRDMRKKGGKWLPYVLSTWTILEFINLFTFFLVLIVRFLWLSKSRSLELRLPIVGYPGDLDAVNSLFQLAVYLNALNTIITCLKVLKFVRLNDRLNILTRTLEQAQQNIFGILLIFIVIVIGFCVTGTSLYGNALEDFKDFNTSMSTLMRILVGDFDYPAMRDENRELTAIYFWAWVIIGLFLMLNFIIAVISEAFSKENDKTKAGSLERTFYKWGKQIKRNFRRNPCSGIVLKMKRRMKKLRERVILQYLIKYRSTLVSKLKAKRRRHKQFKDLDAAALEDSGSDSGSMSSYSSDDDEDDEFDDSKLLTMANPTLYRHEVGKWLPTQERRELTADYIDEMWVDLVEDYEVQNQDEEENERKKKTELVQQAAYSVVTQLMVGAGLIDAPEQQDQTEGGNNLALLVSGRQSFLQMITPNQLSTAAIQAIEKTVTHIEGQLATIARVLCIVDARMSLLQRHVAEGLLEIKDIDKQEQEFPQEGSTFSSTSSRNDSDRDSQSFSDDSSYPFSYPKKHTKRKSLSSTPRTPKKPQRGHRGSFSISDDDRLERHNTRNSQRTKSSAYLTPDGDRTMDSFMGIDPNIYAPGIFTHDTQLPDIKPTIQPKGIDAVVYIPPTGRFDVAPGSGSSPV